jgi:hypothetical protein
LVGLGVYVFVDRRVGTGVQVGGSSDNAVAWGINPVADSCGGGAGVRKIPQAEVRMITSESKKMVLDLNMVFQWLIFRI